MANILPKDKQIAVISALAEGSSIRSIERITGIHRDTIMRLGIRIGQGCAGILDRKMRDLLSAFPRGPTRTGPGIFPLSIDSPGCVQPQ